MDPSAESLNVTPTDATDVGGMATQIQQQQADVSEVGITARKIRKKTHVYIIPPAYKIVAFLGKSLCIKPSPPKALWVICKMQLSPKLR